MSARRMTGILGALMAAGSLLPPARYGSLLNSRGERVPSEHERDPHAKARALKYGPKGGPSVRPARMKYVKSHAGNVEAFNAVRREKRKTCRRLGISGKRYRALERAAKQRALKHAGQLRDRA